MKQKDIAVLVVIIFISAIVSLFVSNSLFGGPKNHNTKVASVPAIDSTLPTPDGKYFNSNAIDPTQLIQIGDTNNSQPFNGQ